MSREIRGPMGNLIAEVCDEDINGNRYVRKFPGGSIIGNIRDDGDVYGPTTYDGMGNVVARGEAPDMLIEKDREEQSW